MVTKKYLIISDFSIRSNNRGTAALGYGAIAFLLENGYIDDSFEIVKFCFYRNPFRHNHKNSVEELEINGKMWKMHTIYTWAGEKLLHKHHLLFSILLSKE